MLESFIVQSFSASLQCLEVWICVYFEASLTWRLQYFYRQRWTTTEWRPVVASSTRLNNCCDTKILAWIWTRASLPTDRSLSWEIELQEISVPLFKLYSRAVSAKITNESFPSFYVTASLVCISCITYLSSSDFSGWIMFTRTMKSLHGGLLRRKSLWQQLHSLCWENFFHSVETNCWSADKSTAVKYTTIKTLINFVSIVLDLIRVHFH